MCLNQNSYKQLYLPSEKIIYAHHDISIPLLLSDDYNSLARQCEQSHAVLALRNSAFAPNIFSCAFLCSHHPCPLPLFRYSSLAREVYCHRIVFRLFSSSMHHLPSTRLYPRCHLHRSADSPSIGSLAYHWQKRISLPETYSYCLLKLSVQRDSSRLNGLCHIIHLVSYLKNCF